MDGASQFGILCKIILPLSMKTIGSVLLIQVISLWNDYQVPLLYLPTHPTIAYATYLFTDATKAIGLTGEFRGRIYYEVSACMLLALPILIIYVIFNKKLMGDLSMGGIKG
jgi:ABC-type glycerol-3-phosphate transport system permease component